MIPWFSKFTLVKEILQVKNCLYECVTAKLSNKSLPYFFEVFIKIGLPIIHPNKDFSYKEEYLGEQKIWKFLTNAHLPKIHSRRITRWVSQKTLLDTHHFLTKNSVNLSTESYGRLCPDSCWWQWIKKCLSFLYI